MRYSTVKHITTYCVEGGNKTKLQQTSYHSFRRDTQFFSAWHGDLQDSDKVCFSK